MLYNRLLRCYVLIDLKIGKLTHQDLGQMQMYVNYFDRHVKTEAESHTIGIVLCKKRIPLWSRLPFPKMPIFTPVNTSFACPARKSCNRNSRNGWEQR